MEFISLESFNSFALVNRYTTLTTEILSDTETPISLYYKLCRDEPYSFLFESAEQDARMGRYSFIGFDPVEVLMLDGDQDPLEAVKAKMGEFEVEEGERDARFGAGFVGYLSYETIHHFEKVLRPEKKAAMDVPEGAFFLPRVVIVFDHIKHVAKLHYLVEEGEDGKERVGEILARLQEADAVPLVEPGKGVEFDLEPSKEEFLRQVEVGKERIRDGEIFQVVLGHSMQAKTDKTSFELYRGLRHKNPSPYMYFIQFEGFAVAGASPETLVRVEDGEVLVRPIAGTRPRGATDEEDKKLEEELLADPKEQAEHRMLVDLGRNDVGRVSDGGTVEVPNEMYIQRFSSVMHIVSDVVGKVAADKDMFDVFRACFPAGTLTGAPKIRAMEIISELENRQRGIYGGAVGYFDFSGNMDFAIAIRTMVYKNGTVYTQAGAGIVHDSIPEKEHEECLHKAQSCLSIL